MQQIGHYAFHPSLIDGAVEGPMGGHGSRGMRRPIIASPPGREQGTKGVSAERFFNVSERQFSARGESEKTLASRA